MPEAKVYIDKIQANLNADPDKSKNINAVFQFTIEGEGGGTWTLDLTKSPGVVSTGAAANPACTIIMNNADFESMMNKTANPMQLYMSQKLKVQGNLPLSLKLQEIIK